MDRELTAEPDSGDGANGSNGHHAAGDREVETRR
jgi:hypothetical protein